MNRKSIFIFILLFSMGLIVGLRLDVNKKNCTNNQEFKYINKLLSCGKVVVVNKAEYTVFSKKVMGYIDNEVKNREINRMAVFFRDLDGGPTVSINGEMKFMPASLLKIPLAVAYFNADEELRDKGTKESILDKYLAFKGKLEIYETFQLYQPKEILSPDTSYSIRDLIFRMLVYSDNGSYEGLLDYLKKLFPDRDYLLGVFDELGILDPKDGLEETLSAKSLASIFRLLYNASYLSKEYSEEILHMLSESEFKAGINAGVPNNIEVAHKFGERQIGENGQWEFHDCGIVYYPSNPYSICLMAEGKDPSQILKVISNVSKMFYEEFDSRKL